MTEVKHTFASEAQTLAADPVLDERVALSLRALVRDQEEEMRQIDATISHLETQLDELRAHRAEVQHSYDLKKGMLAPIRKLPAETLGEIFLNCIPNSDISLNEAPLLVMQVCRRWRRVASGTPCLWTKLYLRSRFTLDPCYIIRMWLSNSGTLPISIRIEHGMWPSRWDRRAAMRLVVQNFHRFRHFTTIPLTEDLCDKLRLPGTSIHAPLLESFTVNGIDEGAALDTRISQLDGCICAPNLTAISLPHNLLMNLTAFHPMSLTSIVLETAPDPEILPSLQFLSTCRNIRSLKLDLGGDILPPNIDGQPPILLPFLEKLSIQFWDEYDPCPFLQTIEVPTLRELTIEGPADSLYNETLMPLPATLDPLLQEGSPLERLHLWQVDLTDGPPFVTMLRKLQNLHSLTLAFCDIDNTILEALTPETSTPPSTWLCPSLSSLNLEGIPQADLVLALIRSRTPVDLGVTSSTVGYLRHVTVGPYDSSFAMLEEITARSGELIELRVAVTVTPGNLTGFQRLLEPDAFVSV